MKDVDTQDILCFRCAKLKDSPEEKKRNKYNAVRTESSSGRMHDSKFEASHADLLEWRKKAGEIKGYDCQYRVEIYAEGKHICDHKIDFRVHELDGSYSLQETKGRDTDDWKWRKKMLDLFWLPRHPDHTYEVIRQRNPWKRQSSSEMVKKMKNDGRLST